MKILAIDVGMTLGYGILGNGARAISGSRALRGNASMLGIAGRHCADIIRKLIDDHGPFDALAFATPFVGEITIPIFKGGRKVGIKRVPVQPDALRPMMGFLMVVEMIADELGIRCTEWEESAARGAFMENVPRKSKDIKRAVIQACRDRGWPATDDHAGDALCIASYALETLEPAKAHETTPLFQPQPPRRGARKPVAR